MIARIKTLSVLLITAVLSLTAAAAPLPASSLPESNLPDDVAAKARLLADNLTQQGFEVLQGGSLRLYTVDDCPASYQEMGLCYANNPAAPYVGLSLPPWDKEYIDPATDTAFGYDLRAPYRLDPREAIVILGDLPPQAAYFGLQSYVVTRQAHFDKHSDLYQYLLSLNKPDLLAVFFTPVPQNHQRILVFASLGNSINHVVIEEQSGEAFSQERSFIITPDQVMDAAVRAAMSELSIPAEDVFTEPIPSNLILGLNKPSDDFVTVIRYSMPADGGDPGDPSDIWRKEPPLAVLRVRDTRPGRQAETFSPAVIEERSYTSEFYLQEDRMDLAMAVAQRWGQPQKISQAARFMVLQQAPFNLLGPECIEIGQNCLADTQDTSYQYSLPLPITDSQVYAVIGTLGTQTGNASYVGLGLTSTIRLLGFDNLSDADLKDTASAYSAQVENTDKFFLYYFTRDCSVLDGLTDGNCLEISLDDIPACNDPTLETCDKLSLSLRDYIYPNSRRGPNDFYKLTTLVIPFDIPGN